MTRLRLSFDDADYDDYGQPKATAERMELIVEQYPYSNPVKRAAAGIGSEESLLLVMASPAPEQTDAFLMPDGMVYRVAAIAAYDPVQVVIAATGQTEQEYLEAAGGKGDEQL